MTDLLYRDFGAARYRTIEERMANPGGLSPHLQVFAPLSTLTQEVADKRYQAAPENALSVNWYVKLNIDSVRDQKSWSTLVVPQGEQLCLFKHLPAYNRLLDVAVLVGCGSHAMLTDVDIVKYSDPATSVFSVAAAQDLSVCTDFAVLAPDPLDAGPPIVSSYIAREDSYLLRVCITPPFTNGDGDGVFVENPGTPCEEKACIKLIVHAHLRNECFADTLRGCRLEDYCDCSSDVPPADCEDPQEV